MVTMNETEKVQEYDLDKRIFRLLNEEPYFTRLSRRLDKCAMPSIPTAGIKYNKESRRFEVVYNPKFMSDLSEEHQKWVLMHELYHASLGHCTTRTLSDIAKGDRKIANCAMDLAINSLPNMIGNAPDFVLLPARKPFEKIAPRAMSAEWYARQIMKDLKNSGGNDKGESGEGGMGNSFDDHDDFGAAEDLTEDEQIEREIAERQLADAIAKAAHECEVGDGETGAAGWGSVSRQTREAIKKFAGQKAKLDPKKVLASFIKASVAADKKTSVTKRSRRLPGKKFGRRHDRRANIAISIDQSGSVSDQMLSKIFVWLNDFAKFASFTVIPFDHQVFEEKIYVWEKGQKRKRERVLCGGTCFTAPTRWVNKSGKFDGHLIITDMYAPKPIRSNCQRMWITDERGVACSMFTPVGERVLVL